MSNRRIAVFIVGLLLAASPLIWFSLDPHAGDKLLQWTSKAPASTTSMR